MKENQDNTVEWGQFIELDLNDSSKNQINYKFKNYFIHSCLETINEEETDTELVDKELDKEKELGNQTIESVLTIPIPFTKKNMVIHLKKRLLLIHFSFTMTSVFALLFYFS